MNKARIEDLAYGATVNISRGVEMDDAILAALLTLAEEVIEECVKVAERGNESLALSTIEKYRASFIADELRAMKEGLK